MQKIETNRFHLSSAFWPFLLLGSRPQSDDTGLGFKVERIADKNKASVPKIHNQFYPSEFGLWLTSQYLDHQQQRKKSQAGASIERSESQRKIRAFFG